MRKWLKTQNWDKLYKQAFPSMTVMVRGVEVTIQASQYYLRQDMRISCDGWGEDAEAWCPFDLHWDLSDIAGIERTIDVLDEVNIGDRCWKHGKLVY